MHSPPSDLTAAFATCGPARFSADRTNSPDVSCIDLKVLKLVQANTTANTRRAYDSDINHFLAWGGSLPTTPVDVARYLAAHAGCLSVATLARRLVAIGQAHTVRGFPNPTTTDLVRLTMRGIRRTYGVPQRRAAALTTGDILSITVCSGTPSRTFGIVRCFWWVSLARFDVPNLSRSTTTRFAGSYMGLRLRFPEASLIKKVVAGKSSFHTDVRRRVRSGRSTLGSRLPALRMGRCFVRCIKEDELDQSDFRQMPLPGS